MNFYLFTSNVDYCIYMCVSISLHMWVLLCLKKTKKNKQTGIKRSHIINLFCTKRFFPISYPHLLHPFPGWISIAFIAFVLELLMNFKAIRETKREKSVFDIR